jgi:pimeloyl-ACP methyl ester carboxylesterase
VLWPLYDAIACPTLLLRGAQSDLLTPQTAQAMSERGPRAQVVEIPGVGHAPTLMSEAQIAPVREFLRQT